MLRADLDEGGNFLLSGTPMELQALRATCTKQGIPHKVTRGKHIALAAADFLRLEALGICNVDVPDSVKPTIMTSQNELNEHLKSLTGVRECLELDPEILNDFEPRSLQPHQKQAVAAMSLTGLRGLCLFDEQGVGKTLTTVAAFINLRKSGLITQLIVIAPKTLLGTWKQEIETFFPNENLTITEIQGSRAERYQKHLSPAEVFLTSFDALKSDLTLFKAIARRSPTLLVVDESFFVKNEQAARSVAVSELRLVCARCFVLCGTPAPNSPLDIVNQVNLADKGWAFNGFIASNNVARDFEAISRVLETRAPLIRRIKETVLPNLPEKSFEIRKIELSPRQRTLYDEARTTLKLYLESLTETSFRQEFSNYLALRSKLSQICIDTRLVSDMQASSTKYEALLNECRRIFEADPKAKIVVWSHFTKSSDVIERLLSEYGVVRVDGQVSTATERQERVRRFQKDPEVRIFLGNPAAAGAGITLTSASISIYVSWSLQAAHYMQSIDRTHRIGQVADSVRYIFLVASDTIEEHDMALIASKQSRQSELLHDENIASPSLHDALRELNSFD